MKQQRWIRLIQTFLICAPCTMFACAFETEDPTTEMKSEGETEVAQAELAFVARDATRTPNPVIFDKSRIPTKRPVRVARPLP